MCWSYLSKISAIFASCIHEYTELSIQTVNMGAAPSKVNVAGDVEVENPVDKSVFRPTPSEKHVEDPSVIPTPSAKREDYEDIIVSLSYGLG